MIERMLRAARLETAVYEEVEADHSATMQALGVVILVAIASAVGVSGGGISGAIWAAIGAVIGWAMWAAITLIVGTTVLATPSTHADWGQLARGLGFAQSIGVLRLLGFVPVLGGLVLFVVFVLQIIAMVIAVKTALDYESYVRAVGVVLIGAIPYIILAAILL